MTTDRQYNGYNNYETWCVTLWLENDQSTCEYWREQARQHLAKAPTASQVRDGYWTIEQAARFLLADQLQQEFGDTNPLDRADVWSDLLSAALDEIDWHEVASQFLADFAPSPTVEPSLRLASPNALASSPAVVVVDLDAARFSLGFLVATPGALDVVPAIEMSLSISRHVRCDWGLVCPEAWQANDCALSEGSRLLSTYDTTSGRRFWVITEADRSTTTILLPDEY